MDEKDIIIDADTILSCLNGINGYFRESAFALAQNMAKQIHETILENPGVFSNYSRIGFIVSSIETDLSSFKFESEFFNFGYNEDDFLFSEVSGISEFEFDSDYEELISGASKKDLVPLVSELYKLGFETYILEDTAELLIALTV